jgi:hypothetical protein
MSKGTIELCSQGVPVLLIICYFLFPNQFVAVSEHTLGKIVAVFCICLYSYIDKVYGLMACFLVILFYHQELETFLSNSTVEYSQHIPKPSKKPQNGLPFENHLEKDFTHVTEAYPAKLKQVKKVNEALFRKERCHNSKVECKSQTMNNHMITHVYPELQFRDGVCNPCDQTCHFTIEKQLQVESDLVPKNTHTTMISDIKDMFGMKKDLPVVVHENLVVSEFV